MKLQLLSATACVVVCGTPCALAGTAGLRPGPSIAIMSEGATALQPPQNVDQVEMSPAQAMALAQSLFDKGKLPGAKSILTALHDDAGDDVDQTQVAFLLGLIAAQEDDHLTAENYFRDILNQQPDLIRVRLELARSLFALRRDQAAAYHFRLALSEELSPAAQENIRVFLNAIERRKIWRVRAQGGIAPDTNVNAGPKDQTVQLFGLPFELSEDAQQTSGIGFTSSLNAEFFPRFSKRWRGEFRAGGSLTDYENIQFDDIFAFAEAGPRYEATGMSASVLGTYSRRIFGGDAYSESVGGKVTLAKGLTSRSRVLLRFAGSIARYDQIPERDGPVYSAAVFVNHAISRDSLASVSFSATREQTQDPVLRNTQYSISGSYRRELPYGVTAQAGPELYYRPFDEFDPINGTTRRDWTYGASVQLTKRDWRLYGFAPVVSYQFLRNESNTDRFDYTRHRTNISLTRTF